MFEFGSRAGFWRVHRIFTTHGLPLTVYAVGQALERNPEAARAMVDGGLGGGRATAGAGSTTGRCLRRRSASTCAARSRRSSGCAVAARGLVHGPDAREHAAARRSRKAGFLYDSDSLRRRAAVLGRRRGPRRISSSRTRSTQRLQVPARQRLRRRATTSTRYLVDTFDQLYEEGEAGCMNVGLHCRIVGRPGRARGARPLPRRTSVHARACGSRRGPRSPATGATL